jgi:hypothetical protein
MVCILGVDEEVKVAELPEGHISVCQSGQDGAFVWECYNAMALQEAQELEEGTGQKQIPLGVGLEVVSQGSQSVLGDYV